MDCFKWWILDDSLVPVSVDDEVDRPLERPNVFDQFSFEDIIDQLPNLHSLELAGTETGTDLISYTVKGDSGRPVISIPKTEELLLKRLPLTYLGLWACETSFENMSVLANEISGCANGYQLLSSAKRWAGNAEMSFEIWYHILDHVANVDDNSMFREICLRMLETYYNDENGFPLLLTQALYHCINTDTLSLEWRQRAIRVLIQCLNFNLDDVGIVKRCLLTLSLFDLPRKGFQNKGLSIRSPLSAL